MVYERKSQGAEQRVEMVAPIWRECGRKYRCLGRFPDHSSKHWCPPIQDIIFLVIRAFPCLLVSWLWSINLPIISPMSWGNLRRTSIVLSIPVYFTMLWQTFGSRSLSKSARKTCSLPFISFLGRRLLSTLMRYTGLRKRGAIVFFQWSPHPLSVTSARPACRQSVAQSPTTIVHRAFHR